METTIVVALVVLLAGSGLWAGMDVYRGYGFRSEQRAFIGALQRARLESMVNMNETAHGVHVAEDSYTVFRGAAFGAEPAWNRTNAWSYRIAFAGNPAVPRDVIFEQLSGVVAAPGTLTLRDSIRNATITVDHEGRISW